MTLIQAGFLGLVEGVTEFLPISSTAHLIVAQRLMGITSPTLFFDTVVQLGALGAVVVYFWKKIAAMYIELMRFFQTALYEKVKVDEKNLPVALTILVASIPVLTVGFILRKKIEIIHESMPIIAFMSITVGLFLALAQVYMRQKNTRTIVPKDVIVMGFYQILALIPGTSRSGVVIAGGLFQGLNFKDALEYSFLLSLPALGTAGIYELISSLKVHLASDVLLHTGVATLISFVSALAVIHFLLTWVRKIGFTPFVLYRIVFGVAVLFIH